MSAIREATCKHFRGIQHKACLAGIELRPLRDASGPGLARWPCLTIAGAPPCRTTCDQFIAPTAEEMAAEDAEIESMVLEALAKGVRGCRR